MTQYSNPKVKRFLKAIMDSHNETSPTPLRSRYFLFMITLYIFTNMPLVSTEKASTRGNIPLIYLRGNHYDIGVQVGSTFRSLIQTAVKTHSTLRSKLVPFYETAIGRRAYNQLLSASEEHLPQYVEEIRGIADGAKADFIELFLLHIEPDLASLMLDESIQQGKGCSDFLIKNDDWILQVHSEDVEPSARYLGSIWMAEIEGSEINNYQPESFVAYAFPGMIPVYAWAVNSYGLLVSGNIISPKRTFSRGMVPRRLLNRALLKEKNINDFIKTLRTSPGVASGFNFMLSERMCSSKTPDCVKMTGIELFSDEKGNNLNIRDAKEFEYHFNEYQYVQEEFYPDPSSKAREKRLQEIKQKSKGFPATLDEIKQVVSDTQNKNFPFYRDGALPDHLATANIVIADMNKQTLSVYKDKPNESKPEVIFDIHPWTGLPLSLTDRIVTPDMGTDQQNRGPPDRAGNKKDEL